MLSRGRFYVILTLAVLQMGCAATLSKRSMNEQQVGLAALQEAPVRRAIMSAEIQGWVARYPDFADAVNNEIPNHIGEFMSRYNVYAQAPLTFPISGLNEVDPFFERSAKSIATVRVGMRLLNFIGLSLQEKSLSAEEIKQQAQVAWTAQPESFAENLQRLHGLKGRLSAEQKSLLAHHVVALSAYMDSVRTALEDIKLLHAEGELLRQRLNSPSFEREIREKDASRSELLPEIRSHFNGTYAGLIQAEQDGPALVRNAKVWQLLLVDTLQ